MAMKISKAAVCKICRSSHAEGIKCSPWRFELVNPDEQLVVLIDETKFQARKFRQTGMSKDFNAVLDAFIEKWELNKDPNTFASLPKKK